MRPIPISCSEHDAMAPDQDNDAPPRLSSTAPDLALGDQNFIRQLELTFDIRLDHKTYALPRPYTNHELAAFLHGELQNTPVEELAWAPSRRNSLGEVESLTRVSIQAQLGDTTVLGRVKLALAMLVMSEPIKSPPTNYAKQTDEVLWPAKRFEKPVRRGFIHPAQLLALVQPASGQIDWREQMWYELSQVKGGLKHLRSPAFAALLKHSQVIYAVLGSGLWGEEGKKLASCQGKLKLAEVSKLLSTLSYEQLHGAFFVWWYWTISHTDSLIWQAVSDQDDVAKGFLAPGIWGLEKRTDNLVWGLSKYANIHLELLAMRFFNRMVDFLNRRYAKPFLVMPSPVAYMKSMDDALNPAHTLYASAGSAFLQGLDRHIVRLLTQAQPIELLTALQWVYMAENLLTPQTAEKWLAIAFAKARSYDSQVVLNPVSHCSDFCDEHWLTDRAALVWTRLLEAAHTDFLAGAFHTEDKGFAWAEISPSSYLTRSSGQGHRRTEPTPEALSFAARSRALFQNLEIPPRYWQDLCEHPLQALSGAMQQKLCGMVLNHLRFPFQTHSLPSLKPNCISAVAQDKKAIPTKKSKRGKTDFDDHNNVTPGGSTTQNSVAVNPVMGSYRDKKTMVTSQVSGGFDRSDERIVQEGSPQALMAELGNEFADNLGTSSGDSMVEPVMQIHASVPIAMHYKNWLKDAQGDGLILAKAYERCVHSGSDFPAVKALKLELEALTCANPDWVCVFEFITGKVNHLFQKLQTKTMKKAGELKPLFQYFLPAFDRCMSQNEWSVVCADFRAVCQFYDQMLDCRFGQHSVRDQMANLIIEFHNQCVSKSLSEVATLDMSLEREDLNLEPQVGSAVRVHYASPAMYGQVLESIAIEYAHLPAEEQQTLTMLHILLYRLTLRRGEILALRLGDFFWAGFDPTNPAAGLCQLVIRGSHLKSDCARRIINLHGLLATDELTWIHARYAALAAHDCWRARFFILSPLALEPTAAQLITLPSAGQMQLDRLLKLWRSQPGMKKFTVHSYRHCAINNALVHLTLSGLKPQERAASLLPWMRDAEFSASRNIEVTQSITALPVSSEVRQVDIAFELIRLCGHLHFRTTRSTYLHLFAWVTLVALNRSHNINLSKADWAKVLGLKGRANVDQRGVLKKAYGIDGDLDSGMPSAHLLVGRITERLRKVGLVKNLH